MEWRHKATQAFIFPIYHWIWNMVQEEFVQWFQWWSQPTFTNRLPTFLLSRYSKYMYITCDDILAGNYLYITCVTAFSVSKKNRRLSKLRLVIWDASKLIMTSLWCIAVANCTVDMLVDMLLLHTHVSDFLSMPISLHVNIGHQPLHEHNLLCAENTRWWSPSEYISSRISSLQ